MGACEQSPSQLAATARRCTPTTNSASSLLFPPVFCLRAFFPFFFPLLILPLLVLDRCLRVKASVCRRCLVVRACQQDFLCPRRLVSFHDDLDDPTPRGCICSIGRVGCYDNYRNSKGATIQERASRATCARRCARSETSLV